MKIRFQGWHHGDHDYNGAIGRLQVGDVVEVSARVGEALLADFAGLGPRGDAFVRVPKPAPATEPEAPVSAPPTPAQPRPEPEPAAAEDPSPPAAVPAPEPAGEPPPPSRRRRRS